ncbi:helix-turn-helix domain-containing protein [Streptomyces sp. NPDC001381]|uniref:helix-turn-helix domain-containing protein n=1 Tax=Streptomyces sp. NPDC001381 TaxID=3364567 RepID=UPI0036BA1805
MSQGELPGPYRPRSMVFQRDVDRAHVGAERYELALALRDLAQRLGVSLSRYAVRVSWDRSTLSRYFSGVLVPPAEFVEQLIDDGDRETSSELTPAARDLVRRLHRSALRATSPQSAALQDLRDELAAADRESRHLQQETELLREMVRSAHERLREQQVRLRQLEHAGAADRLAHRAELAQWTADFASVQAERDALQATLTRLSAELADAEGRARDAEERCAVLEQRLETAEAQAEEHAAGAGEPGDDLARAGAAGHRDVFMATGATRTTNGDGVSFHLGITAALGARLAQTLDEQAAVPLTEADVRMLAPGPGIFQLIRRAPDRADEPVYLGKADHSLPRQLEDARMKILGREHLLPEEMYFTSVYVEDDLSAVAPELLVLKHLRDERGIELPWNRNGFGSREAGRNRDRTQLSALHFDMVHPIDLGWVLHDDGRQRVWSVRDFAGHVKARLPYVFRYTLARGHADAALTEVPPGPLRADAAFRILARGLGPSWQVSALKGRVLLYEEHTDYPSAVRYYRGEDVLDA